MSDSPLLDQLNAEHKRIRAALVPQPPAQPPPSEPVPQFPFLPRQYPPFNDCPSPMRIRRIQEVVANHFEISITDIRSARRTARVVLPRQIAMYLAKSLTLRSLVEIGRQFGGRDHTTVLHAVRKIGDLINGTQTSKRAHSLKVDEELAEEVAELKGVLLG
jgi:hypothetical protein